MAIINPQTQAGRNFAARDGIQPTAQFYWNPLINNWAVWDSTVTLNAATSNVALEAGGNLAAIVASLATLTAAVNNVTQGPDLTTLLVQILMQLQFIATGLNAPIVNVTTPVLKG